MNADSLKKMFDLVADMQCVTDLNGRIIAASASWEKLLGYAPDKVVEKEYTAFVHADDVERTENFLGQLKKGEGLAHSTLRFCHADGTFLYIGCCAMRNGDRVLVVGKEQQDSDMAMMHQFETLFDAIQDALFLVENNEDGFCYLMNNSMHKKLTGFYDIKGKSPEDLVGSHIGTKISENYARCIYLKKQIEYEETLDLPGGYRVWHTVLTPVFKEEGAFIVGSSQDITQQKKAEKEMQRNLIRNESLVNVLQHNAQSIQEYLDYVLQQALVLTESRFGYIYFYNEKTEGFTLNTWSSQVMKECEVQDKQTVYKLDKTGIWGEAVRQRKPIIINDFGAPNALKKGYPKGHVPLNSFLTIPVLEGTEIVAVVGVANKETDYSDIDVWQLTILMNNVWKVVEKIRSDQQLYKEKERLRITLLSVGDGVIVTDDQGRVELMNEIAERLTGWALDDAKGRPFCEVFSIIDEYTGQKREDPVQKVLSTGKLFDLANYTILISKNGERRTIADSASPIQDEDSVVRGVILVFRDVTVQRQKQALIEHLSFHDQLTGIYNRRFFEDQLLRMDYERNLPLSIIMADVNGLKLTNDAFGHATGDRLLVRAADILQSCCRQDDVLARLGGDEFVILLPKTNEEQAGEIAKRIMADCAKVKVEAVTLSISFGWAAKTKPEKKIYDVLKASEDRMYQRKFFEGPSIRGKIIDSVMQALYEVNSREKKHSERVSQICEKMGKAMMCPEREVQELKMAGLLHDIGKVAIDTSVLDKEEALNEKEWTEVKRHPEIGYRILGALNDMTEIAQIVLTHHEHMDGSGYPQGLSGEKIPLQARVLSIADAYDAMTFGRPYRPARSKEEAVKGLIAAAGTQFDKHLMDIFINKVLPLLNE